MRLKLAIYALFTLLIFSIVGFAIVRITHGTKSKSVISGTQIFKGPVEKTIYSSLQVEVVVKNHRIIDVIPLVLPNSDTRSIALARLSVPILRREAIHENSATIQGVSGASVTSSAYMRSLAGALAQAGL
jgi:uncharacterized protein with FMN-binding domain